MRLSPFRTVPLVLACWACAALADEPSAVAKKLAQKLTAEQKAFADTKKKAKADLVRAFKAAEAAAVQNDPTPLGVGRQKSLKAEREAFEKADALPTSDDALEGVFTYLSAVQKARPKVRQAHEKLIQQYGKDGNKQGEANAKADLAAFDASVQGVERFTPGSRWSGSLQKPRSTTNIGFTVRSMTDDLVKGQVSLDNGWCQMEVEGLRDGPQFVLRVTKMVIGDPQQPVFSGFMLGDRMVIEVAGLKARKGTVGGVAALTRTGG